MLTQRIREARQNEDGFTLIELIIVIVILGVLAGIVVFSVRGITDTGNNAACQATYKTTVSALEAYRAKNNAYPGAPVAGPPASGGLTELVTGGFLQSDPTGKLTYAVAAPYTLSYTAGGSCATATLP